MVNQHIGEEAIFQVARQIAESEVRETYLQQVCGSDADLRARVGELLAVHEGDRHYIASPAACIDVNPRACMDVGTQIGHYKLREQVGEGGMGIVYVADQIEPVKRKVALKIIKPGMASRYIVNRFESERQALSMMDHPNIARVFDGGVTDTGQPYFVMELVQGLPITQFCDDHRLTTHERLRLFVTICKAVHHAHQKGIIHRDLKPSNIIVADIDDVAVPKVIDFGVAKAVNQSLTKETLYTQFTQMVGTPLYMSPEQTGLGVIDIDIRSDVYSLGVLLYELLTGRTPFDSDTLKQVEFDEMRRIIREDDPPRPSDRISTLNGMALSTVAEHRSSHAGHLSNVLRGELDWIVMKSLEKDRNRRYESASVLADDIERHLRDEPIVARPASRWYRTQKFVRRNRALVASLTAVFFALSLGAALALAGLLHAIEQRDVARMAEEGASDAERAAQERAVQLAATLDEKEAALETVKREQEDNHELISLLSDMYPKPYLLVSPGLNHTVLEAIEELSAQINNGRLRDHPRVEIEVRTVFADSYLSADEFHKFREHLDKALELAEQEYGANSLIVARIHQRLAFEIAYGGGRFMDPARVLRHATKAIEILERVGEPNSRLWTSKAWTSKAYALVRWPERHDEAIEAARKAVEFADMKSFTLMELGDFLAFVEDEVHFDQAHDSYTQALEIYERHGNPRANIKALFLHHQAAFHRLRGELSIARDGFQEAYDLYQSPDLRAEPECHAIGWMLADLHFAMGEVDQAFALVDALERTAEEFNVTSSLVQCPYLRGWLHFQLGDYEASIPLFKEAKRLAKDKYGMIHGLFGMPCLYLALTYEALEKPEDAAKQFQELLPLTQRYVDAPYVNEFFYWVHARGILATSSGDSQQLRHAEEIAAAGLENVRVWRQSCREPAFHVLTAMIQHTQNPGQIGSTIDELRQVLDKVQEPTATIRNTLEYHVPTDRWHVENKLIELLLENERQSEAHGVLMKAVTIRGSALDPNHIQTILAEIRLGEFRKQQELHDADTVMELADAFEKLRRFSPVIDGVRRRLAQLLIDAYEDVGDAGEAAKWRLERKQLNETSDERGQVSRGSIGSPRRCVHVS